MIQIICIAKGDDPVGPKQIDIKLVGKFDNVISITLTLKLGKSIEYTPTTI